LAVVVAVLFLTGLAFKGAAACVLPETFFEEADLAARLLDCFSAGDCFAAGRAGFEDLLADLVAADDLAGEAFRTGAFSAAARFGLGFADCAVSLRLLAEDLGAELCGAGREELLFAPLMTGSLMRSTRFSQIASHRKREAADLRQLNTRGTLNQRGSRICGKSTSFGASLTKASKEKLLKSSLAVC
jgi:hypothetical protein